jgi:hypothetical protein
VACGVGGMEADFDSAETADRGVAQAVVSLTNPT